MGTTQTIRNYALAEFTSATQVNEKIFAQELQDDAAVVDKPDDVYRAGSTVSVVWNSVDPGSATITAVDAAVAAHTGGEFVEPPLTEIVEAETSDDSGDEQTRASLVSGKLPAGNYLFSWYCEVKTDDEVAGTAAQARLYVTKNGGSEIERGVKTWQFPQYNEFSGSFPTQVNDGDSYTLRLAWERLGSSSNPAYIQRTRLAIVKL